MFATLLYNNYNLYFRFFAKYFLLLIMKQMFFEDLPVDKI
jgi:hypothetical protein